MERRRFATRQQHLASVERIARQLRQAHAQGQRVHIEKRSGHHVVPLPNDRRFTNVPVDISGLNHILELDRDSRICVVEPGITFSELLPVTLKEGLIPTVVPELEGITVGGAVAGCSLEAMSYRYGGFHDSCSEYEVIGGDGEVTTCSAEREPLIFELLHGSYGSLGILSQITFQLVRAKPFVRLQYRHLKTFSDFQRELYARCLAADFDFIDAIIHSPRHFVVCLGTFVDSAPYLSDYRQVDIYYRSTARRKADYLTTADYCFRYDADCHWLTRTMPPLEWRPVRRLLGRRLLGSTNLIRWSNRLARILALKKRPDVVCDVFIPDGRFEAFYRWYEQDFRFFPLWVVPYRLIKPYPWVNPAYAERMMAATTGGFMIDCAIYGKPNNEPEVDYSKLLEDKTFELCGIKTLISRNHYDAQRFWTIYHQKAYEDVKRRLDPAGVFPHLFDTYHHVP